MAEKTSDPAHAMFGLNDEAQGAPTAETPAAPQPAPPQPQYVYVQPQAAPSARGNLFWLVIVLLVVSAINLVLGILTRVDLKNSIAKHSDQLDLLTRRMDSSDERYAQLRGQFQVTTERLGLTQQELGRARSLAAEVQKQQQTAVKQLNDAIAQKASADEVNKLQADSNAKIGGLSTDLAGTKQDLEKTKADFNSALTGTKGELTGAIARTHDELVALAHRTDRDYFEFSLARKRAQQKVGNITVELLKTDTKRNTFTLNLLADDKWIQRKDKAMNEPVYFYLQGASSALELVVNKLGKDSIAGYISTPKGFFPNTPNVLAARPGV